MGKLITQLDAADSPVDWDNEYIATRDTQAAGNKTRRRRARDYKDDWDAGITAATAAAQTAQDTADDAQDTADLALLTAQQLSSLFVVEPNGWDALNNNPALSDATGVVNQAYAVNVTGLGVDLGSGPKDFPAGTLAYYAGGVWNPGPALAPGVTSLILEAGTEQGDITLTLDKIPATASRSSVTPDHAAGLSAGVGGISAINKVVSQQALDAAIAGISGPSIVVIGDILTPQTFSDGINDCDNGENTLLSSVGYTNGSAEAQWPLAAEAWGSIDASTTSFADVQWQSVLWSLKSGINYTVQSLSNKAYAFNRCGILIPSGKDSPNINTDSQHYEVNFSNCLYYNRSGAPKTIFLKQPEDQTEADIVIDNQWTFKNGKFRGPGGVGDIGMKIGATRGCRFQFLEFQNFQYGLQGGFLLNSRFEEVNSISCSSAGVFIDKGWWSGAGYSNAGAQPKFYNCRFRMTGATQRGLWVIGPDGAAVYDSTVEGTDAAYGIFIDTNTSTVSKNARVVNLHAEIGSGNQFTNAVVGFSGRDFYTFIVDAIYNQSQAPDTTLVECTATQGTTTMKVLNCKGNTGSGRFKFRNINSGGAGAWVYEDTQIQGDPDTVDDIRNDGLCYTADSDIPPAARIRYTKPLA